MNHALVSNPVLIFFIVLAIILLAPLILNRFKIPHVIGLIVAGLAVGPYGLHLLDRDSSFEIFGQVGLLYLMFLAGLEIDMFHLKQNVRRGLVFGLLTFFVPLLLGAVISVWLLRFDWLTSMLLASMYASHTLISYPVVARFGITKSQSVLTAIVGTIVAVIGALLVLAITVNATETGSLNLGIFLKLIFRLTLYFLGILYVYPRLTRWFFKTYNDPVLQFVYVLALVFLAAWLAQVIGLEAVLGAFFAGLVLNRFIPNVSPLMVRIEFVGNALFIPYFLIGVGMMINIHVIGQLPALEIASVMLVIALFGKWFAAWITQRIFKFNSADRGVLFGLTTAHTAVALAVVTIGYNIILPNGQRMLDENVLNGTILMILITCAIAPVVTASAAAKVKLSMLHEELDSESEKSSSSKIKRTLPRRRTLIPVSNPVTAQSLMELAMMMKRSTTNDSVFALHVRNDNSPSAKAIGENALKIVGETAAAVNVELKTIERFDMNTVTGILNTIAERNIHDVVLGMHFKTNVVDSYFGNIIESLLQGTNKMVIINRCYTPLNTINRIVVAVPQKAEYETGFVAWVVRVATLAHNNRAMLEFRCAPETAPMIRGVMHNEKINVRYSFSDFTDWDDFSLLANEVLDDQLLIVVSARHTSLSFNNAMDGVPGFLSKYFGHNNLIIIYPEQFGESPNLVSFTDPLTAEINSTAMVNRLQIIGRSILQWLRKLAHGD